MKTIVVLLFFAVAQGLLPVSYMESTSHTGVKHHQHFQQKAIAHSSALVIDETTVEEDVHAYFVEPFTIFLAIAQISLKKESIFIVTTKSEFSFHLLRYISRLITSPPTLVA